MSTTGFDSDAFFAAIDEDLGWRKKELTALLLGAQDITDAEPRRALFRAGVVLFYAHWEGFVKFSTEKFLRHLDAEQLGLPELHENYVLLLKPEGKDRSFERASKELLPPRRTTISSQVLCKICWVLALDYTRFQPKETRIDRMRTDRNSIAHGEETQTTEQDFHEMGEHVRWLLEVFSTEIRRAVIEKTYLRAPVATAAASQPTSGHSP